MVEAEVDEILFIELEELQGRLAGWEEDFLDIADDIHNMTLSDWTAMGDIRDEMERIVVVARLIGKEAKRLDGVLKEVVKSGGKK